MRVVFTRVARRDLLDIAAYITHDAPIRAKTFLDELEQKCKSLADNPAVGAMRPDLLTDVRLVPYGSYNIYYLPLADRVRILRIYHSARLIEAGDLPI